MSTPRICDNLQEINVKLFNQFFSKRWPIEQFSPSTDLQEIVCICYTATLLKTD
jgi:hypothetical protein